MRAIIAWLLVAGGAVVALVGMLYLPAATSVDDISAVPPSILIVISVGEISSGRRPHGATPKGATFAAGT